MANKLIEELIIKVKQSGAPQVTGELKKLNKELDKVKANSNIDIEVSKRTDKSMSNLEKLIRKQNGYLATLSRRSQAQHFHYKKMGENADTASKGIEKMTRAGNSQARSMSSLAKAAGPLPLLYANIAANVFALSEAFRLITEGEQLNRLEQVGTIMGAKIGVPVQAIANEMKELTGGTLSYGDALRQATAAASYGFDSTQITQMTMAARRASIALGVDMQDAMNRVIKGTSKLEIELLDELGVTTKLTTAYENYANKLGISATALNEYQKRAALVNEINSQSVDKFGDLDEKLKDSSAWETFGANASSAFQGFFQDLAKATEGFANFINEIDESQGKARNVYDSFYNLRDSINEAFAKDSRGGMISLTIEANKELDKMRARLRELEPQWDKSLGLPVRDEIKALRATIKNLDDLLAGQDLGVSNLVKADEAYKNLNVVVKGSLPTYTELSASIRGQSAQYERLYDSVSNMQAAYRLLKNTDPMFDSEKALKSLGFESEAAMNKAVKLAESYKNANTALARFAATSAQATLKQRKQGVDAELTNLNLIQEELKYQQQLLNAQKAMGALPTKRAATEAKIAQLQLKELDTRTKIVDIEVQRANTQAKLAQDGLRPELLIKKDILENERSRLANLKMIEGSQLQQEQSLNRIKQLENEILAVQTAQSNAMMNSALGNLSSFAPGIDMMTSSINSLAMSFDNMGQSSMTATQMVSSGLSAFQGMLQYASNDAISTIEAQIKAEQKRDGKSKESVAKINALEKKKIDQQKKAAKQSILISTAVAVMNAAANPWPVPAIPLMASAALAGGLAYQQASSASSNLVSAASSDTQASLTLGERSNQVDVSQGATRGELGYIRNESGTGSLQSFTPRANGGVGTPGNSIVVGEDGPEVITPLEPVRAYSAEESGSMGKGGGYTTENHFHIDTMDAQSFLDNRDKIVAAWKDGVTEEGMNPDRLY